MKEEMNKIKLNKDFGKMVIAHAYELSPTEKYYICLDDEFEQQMSILSAVKTMGLPAMKDYHMWLENNGFNIEMPNPTNEFVATFFGSKPLWCTDLSQGIVVKAENEDDYFIVMECSKENEGFEYTQVLLTFGGCM